MSFYEYVVSQVLIFDVFMFCSQQAANESAMEEDLGLIGASAEDTEAELIRKICETELLAGNKNLIFFFCLTSSCINNPFSERCANIFHIYIFNPPPHLPFLPV